MRPPESRAKEFVAARATYVRLGALGSPRKTNLVVLGWSHRCPRLSRRRPCGLGSLETPGRARLARSGSLVVVPCPRPRPDVHRVSATGREGRVVAGGRRLGRRRPPSRPPRSRPHGTRPRSASAPHGRVLRPGRPPASVHPGPAGSGGTLRRAGAGLPRQHRSTRTTTRTFLTDQKTEQQLMSLR